MWGDNMPNILLDLVVDRVDLVDEGADSEAFIKLYKRKENCDNMTFKELLEKMKPEHIELVNAEMAKAAEAIPEATATELAKAKADLDAVTVEVTKAKEDLATVTAELETVNKSKEKVIPSEEDVLKGLDPAVQEIFKSMKAKQLAAEEIAKGLEAQKLHDEAVVKAKELKNLPLEEAKMVEVVKSASDEVYEVLKSANKALEDAGVFKSVGSDKDTDAVGDAWEKINKKAEVIAAAENVTIQKAIAKVVKDEPDLYKEYLKGGLK